MFRKGMNLRIPISEPLFFYPDHPLVTWGISPIPVWEKAHSQNRSSQYSNASLPDAKCNTNRINKLPLPQENSTAPILTVCAVHEHGWRQL